MFSLKDRVAIVTGASGDIGAATSRALHAQGAKLIISGTRLDALERLASELGNNVHIKLCDLRESDSVENLVEEAKSIYGKLDILVCNAGITKDMLAIRMKNEDFDDVINVNLKSSFILNRAAIKSMIKARYGRIINIASVVGVTGNPGQANYCASKAGLIGMTKSLAAETASRGITMNCVAPGFIETAMTSKLGEEQRANLFNKIPAGCFGKAEDVANAVVFLASEESSYINGQTIHVNGGMLMV
ncbi:3-oxoacyl-[acyl-carrier-protein] reductase FabG [Candidatus Arcanobacter lacustris]|uniref:3-oxoacyl-[acyl-carrier-protein] reductase n=1 Tax=Candidatus Arcanibacter lacustris TaxID=1607817 RepID=A0A0F5MP03_9RICK|nr:3-oxoacyl-[acyl-carrier-protein] reductase FabG [Candidatus Arcanobacter lacustris]